MPTRQRLLLDRNWRFALGHAADASKDFEFARDRSLVKSGEARGAAGVKFDDSAWRVVDLPHDWAIELPRENRDDREFCEHGFRCIGPDFPQNSVGWYRRRFDISRRDLGRRIWVEFEGVFRDSIAWINGHRLGRHESGHTSFRYDLTDLLNYGGENVLAVRVDATCYEGWWYEGAGIYRHVWLTKLPPVHVAHDGTFVTTRLRGKSAVVTVRTTIVNDADNFAAGRVESLVSRRGRNERAASRAVRLPAWSSRQIVQKITVPAARLWSPNEPNLYQLQTVLRTQRGVLDSYPTTFGIRTFKWDARRGFFLNGKPLKIKGTCNHHQHAGVGTAMPDSLHEFRVRKLKEMGANAYRCSHYAATPALLDACDRLGMLVMAENRLAGSSPLFLDDFRAMIVRDRNHPSIFLWSIGNEEHTIQWSIAGERIGRTLVRTAHQLDPTRKVTAAMHDRGLGEGFANVVDVHGWNYIHVGDIEAFHRRRPEQPIIGSEEGSTVCTRGEYTDDPARGYVSAYDRRHPKWGSTAAEWWRFFADRRWIAGGFVWTGFDYFGEPIPYKWPCIASHFGLIDMCGFPKDLYWYFKAWWSERPVLHLFPHWTWPGREGREIDVRCFTNHDEVELRVNGRALGRKRVERNSHVGWMVQYEPGAIEAIGYRKGKPVERRRIETTGAPVRLQLTADRSSLRGDGEDTVSIAVCALDHRGRVVPTADNFVEFGIEGPGRLLGVGNGDPSDHSPDKATRRKLFNGHAAAIVQAGDRPGPIRVIARAAGLRSERITVPVARAPARFLK